MLLDTGGSLRVSNEKFGTGAYGNFKYPTEPIQQAVTTKRFWEDDIFQRLRTALLRRYRKAYCCCVEFTFLGHTCILTVRRFLI